MNDDDAGALEGGGDDVTVRRPSNVGRTLRWVLPFLVSAAFLWYVVADMDVSAIFARLTPRVALYFGPPLVVFLAFTLWIEARCLTLVVETTHQHANLFLAARIKAASYLLGLLNYALGAAAVTVLLRRRAGMRLSEAAGAVFIIGLLDLTGLLLLVIIGGTLLGTDGTGVQVGVVVLAAFAIAAGFAVLRAPIRMGAFDRVRELRILRSARELPVVLLLHLGMLRLAFVGSFIALTWATLIAFQIAVPFDHLILDVAIMLLVAALPIAAAGLGTGQWIFVELFRRWADPETLLAASLTLSFALIVTRLAIGLCFAREFAAEAFAHADEDAA